MNNNALFKITQKYILYRGADKSLDRPGRKQATATKLQLLQATQKQFGRLSVQPGLHGSDDLRVGRKWRPFNCFFFSQVGLKTYQHPCIIWANFKGSGARRPLLKY